MRTVGMSVKKDSDELESLKKENARLKKENAKLKKQRAQSQGLEGQEVSAGSPGEQEG